jgi:hypothetical protein
MEFCKKLTSQLDSSCILIRNKRGPGGRRYRFMRSGQKEDCSVRWMISSCKAGERSQK